LIKKVYEKYNYIDFNKYENKKYIKLTKEKSSRVSLNYEKEINSNEDNNISFKLPDGNEIFLDKELFICTESIFKPELLGVEMPGVHFKIYNSIMKSKIENRKELFSNIILSGGNTLLINYQQRIKMEMKKLVPENLSNKIKIIAPSERKYATWIGGSILAGLGNFQYMWITQNEYQDCEPQIVHRKCL